MWSPFETVLTLGHDLGERQSPSVGIHLVHHVPVSAFLMSKHRGIGKRSISVGVAVDQVIEPLGSSEFSDYVVEPVEPLIVEKGVSSSSKNWSCSRIVQHTSVTDRIIRS